MHYNIEHNTRVGSITSLWSHFHSKSMDLYGSDMFYQKMLVESSESLKYLELSSVCRCENYEI
jgi:hypothetical protein